MPLNHDGVGTQSAWKVNQHSPVVCCVKLLLKIVTTFLHRRRPLPQTLGKKGYFLKYPQPRLWCSIVSLIHEAKYLMTMRTKYFKCLFQSISNKVN